MQALQPQSVLQHTVFDLAAQNVEKFLIDNLSPEEIVMTLKSLQHFQRLVCVRVQGSSDYKLDLAGAELLGETVRKTGCKEIWLDVAVS